MDPDRLIRAAHDALGPHAEFILGAVGLVVLAVCWVAVRRLRAMAQGRE
jgi:hypothetical protein